ncbi:MAG: argininosuccinate lyase [Ruminococcaceae bacterium]|nr:argininosuccinate lyase [Oscillospiraceae bacterium]
MNKMWAGRQTKETDKIADDFNSSIHFDSRMYRQDITGSIAHATMLAHRGIISNEDKEKIIEGLTGILGDIESGKLPFDLEAEDIHMFIEGELTARIGDAGKRLHTARSRNDQVAVDIRLYLRDEVTIVIEMVKELIDALASQAEANKRTIMPGYTHLQRAQPIVFGHHLLAYCMMLIRDVTRLEDAVARMNYSPLGSCALSGTTYNTDRRMTAELLGFDGIMENSMDGVSDRDFCLELMSAFSIIMMHLSRLSEEIILWSSWEFSFVELDDAYTTGSSIMPQKKNSDMAELVRGKTGRVYGDLVALLTVLKGLPLAYNKDMQEDKEAVFDSLDTVKKCVEIFIPMIKTMKVKADNMYRAACRGFINATDLADYLVASKGMPFRTAYKITGGIIGYCIEKGKILDDLTVEEYKSFDENFDEGVYEAISLENCIARRISEGSTGYASVDGQIEYVKKFLGK